jgi:hypothetical protein
MIKVDEKKKVWGSDVEKVSVVERKHLQSILQKKAGEEKGKSKSSHSIQSGHRMVVEVVLGGGGVAGFGGVVLFKS